MKEIKKETIVYQALDGKEFHQTRQIILDISHTEGRLNYLTMQLNIAQTTET